MKKSIKKTAAVFVAAALASTCVFAQSSKKPEMAKKFEMNIPEEEYSVPNGRRMEMNGHHGMMMRGNENVLVGKVKKVDLKAQKIIFTNADGKEVEVNVNPFTRLFVEVTDENFKKIMPAYSKGKRNEGEKKNAPEGMRNSCELSDIHSGDWVMVSVFKSDTKALSAEAVFAKVKKTDPDANINAK